MKNFLLVDSSELMAVRLISASRAHFGLLRPKTFDSYFLDTMYAEFMKNFLSQFELANGCLTHFGLLSPKMFDSYFLDMMFAEFMKNFLLLDSSELMAVRLISAS